MPSGGDRTANLLNLLKFTGQGITSANQGPQQQDQQSSASSSGPNSRNTRPENNNTGSDPSSGPVPMPRILQPAPSSADPSGLLAALMRGDHEAEEPRADPKTMAPTNSFTATSPPGDSRQFLLDLLNRPKPSQADPPLLHETSRSTDISPQSDPARGAVHNYNPDISPQSDLPRGAVRNYNPALQASTGSSSYPSFPSAVPVPSNTYNYNQSTYEQPASYPFSSVPDGTAPWLYGKPHDGISASSQDQMSNAPQFSEQLGLMQGDGHSTATPQFQILKKPQSTSSTSQTAVEYHRHGSDRNSTSSPGQGRRLAEQHSSSPNAARTPGTSESYASMPATVDRHKETVSEAINELAEQADREAQEALARAEQEHIDKGIARDIKDMLRAQTDKDFHDSAKHAAQGIQKELDRQDNYGILEQSLPPHVAEEVRQIVDDAALGIADSWESADADEHIVVDEETARATIRVYNFPMKPWISITLLEGSPEPRPLFSDNAQTIVDIARLKKDFDQIDRNLFTATEHYMVYGMSKAGGLRVIRQEDGRDAKIFTETKDRIFNLSMSVTPPDHSGVHREAIIGTGISGTVYWVQLKDGEKDHIEDAHPEQYGFALPPITSQEGDTPGGVLKTRARPSTIHPEYFAVGRGKSINIIWPSYIMHQNLFKPGHDRVVDTETLVRQCSLKINTGKAGKDFTFSQDDSLIASLDKSGRVKFWDVRDLTAIKDGSDPRSPVPAQTSLEIKEPLLILNSTPEGEKAWPTSVMLLDKLRPYQKRCALRYMIVQR